MSTTRAFTPGVTPELTATLRRLKLGQLVDTLPERLALAKTSKMSHAECLQLLLADEVTRRDTTSAARKAKAAGLDERMRLCLLYTSPSPRDRTRSRMPSSA